LTVQNPGVKNVPCYTASGVPGVTAMPMIGSLNWATGTARLDPLVIDRQNITYSFVPTGNFAPTPNAPGGRQSVGWNDYEVAQFTKAIKIFETFLPLNFNSIGQNPGTYANAVFVSVNYFNNNANDFGAFMPPGEPNPGRGEFNFNGVGWDELGGGGLEKGGQGFQTIVHELGHALGLKHPHDDGGGGEPIYDGVTSPFDDYGDFNQNQGIYTMMSYNQGWQTGPAASRPDAAGKYGRVATPMAFDIFVLQQKYGANLTHATGNNTYTLPDKNGVGTFWMCIWDAGGGNDTIRYNGSKTAVIDLNMASLAHAANGGGMISNAKNVAGGFTIANGVWIENAIGGNGIDKITGNARNNDLFGRNGNDTIKGNAGHDIIEGGLGRDIVYGGPGNDRFVFTKTTESRVGASRDIIQQFGVGADRIDLSDIDARTTIGGNQAFSFIGAAAFSGVAGQLRGAAGLVQGDVNGDRIPDFEIKVIGGGALVRGDFIL
jgi:serralysin